MERIDLVVVGGGLAGLTAARLAQAAGTRVVVVEPHRPGGRARTDDRRGFAFNRGPHALYEGGAARAVLAGLGITPTGGSPATHLACGLLGDELVALPASPRSLVSSRLLGWRGRVALGRLLARLTRQDAAALADRTVAGWLDDLGLPDDARRLVALLVRVATYADAPELLSADVAVSQMQLALGSGVRYLDGGWQQLVDALAVGLTFHRTAATRVEVEGGHVVVETDDGPLLARAAVLAAGGPAATAALLDGHSFDVGPAVDASCLDLGTRRPASPPLVFGLDRPLYLSTHGPPAALAPAGRSVVHLARYLAPGETDHADADRAELEALARRTGIGDDDVVERRFLRRMTVVGAMPTPDRGGLAGRPSVGVPGRPGVFLAGDWVGRHGFLADAALASAAEAARLATALVAV